MEETRLDRVRKLLEQVKGRVVWSFEWDGNRNCIIDTGIFIPKRKIPSKKEDQILNSATKLVKYMPLNELLMLDKEYRLGIRQQVEVREKELWKMAS